MGEPFLAEVRIMSFGYAPRGWALCNGQLLPINQNQALFSLLGTTYGGNGQTTFALPDFRGRVPVHTGAGFIIGQKGGEEAHSLTLSELSSHTHLLQASNQLPNRESPTNNFLTAAGNNAYTSAGPNTAMHPTTLVPSGGISSQPHNNMQPYLVLNFCIALQGIFPSRN